MKWLLIPQGPAEAGFPHVLLMMVFLQLLVSTMHLTPAAPGVILPFSVPVGATGFWGLLVPLEPTSSAALIVQDPGRKVMEE